MKQTTRIWLLAAAALVLVGALMFAGVMAVNHWDFSVIGSGNYESNKFDIRETFQDVSIRSDTADIRFLPSDGGTCRVVIREHPKVKRSAFVLDGVLTIETIDTRKWYDHVSPMTGSPEITVWLPQGAYGSLLIEERTGDIAIPKDFSFESVGISASTGDVACCASAAGTITIGTDTGDIRVKSVSAGALDLSVSTGRVELRGVACAGTLGVRVSTGKTFLTDVSCGSIFSNGSTGDITLEHVTAAAQMSIERSTGDVKLEQCDAGELSIQTGTGDVTGSLRSDKVFITQSDTGRVDVPETTRGGKCKITTDTGDISIRID
jgi:hypothetical protein